MKSNKLDEIFAEVDKVTINLENQCINCGASLSNDYSTKCEVCGYDSENEFMCPYKTVRDIKLPDKIVELGFCILTKQQCKVRGLDFEICSTFRSLDGLKEPD